ncbi:hypothetical protein EJ02DRAFT_450276 [Clathrospora elynae]|uniref:C2H2-type domain-containing protein n=1 Tax=Clathrospora elynae TaxID=706981 RepID=A0A6A5T2X6_9PLEO|nr:hypothetical protein EJ02DRAFT_450276 [Clathrospora elynae]
MDRIYTDDWQLPPWAEDTIDPQWLSDFVAADPTQDLAPTAAAISGIDNININSSSSFQDFTVGETSPGAMSALLSPGCTLDTVSCQALGRYERSLEQRQHTLPRRRSKYLLRRSASRSSPIVIPNGSPSHAQSQSLAMQRWQNSPPEDEAASLSAIYNALDDRPFGASPRSSQPSSRDAFRKYRNPSSTTSLDSAASESSLRSWNSGHSAASQSNRRTQAPRVRAKGQGKNMHDPDRIFKCTFCCDTFKHKYDWTRHEKSLHLNMEEWICTPHGASVMLPLTGRVHCAYCSALDPTPEHLQQHNHSDCIDGRSTPRVFRRKDHLVQHLRLVHGLDTLPLIDDWKLEPTPVASRCGFCYATLNSWDERADHISAHFHNGKTMADWQGNHGFDATVAARVTDAFPPYLIASQSTTVVPFSATDPASLELIKQLITRIELEEVVRPAFAGSTMQDNGPGPLLDAQIIPTKHDVNFAAVLTRHLSRFARQQMLLGVIPTDEMFQRESRRLLYNDGDDDWNQTVADHPNWLQEFRKRSGLGDEPSM